MLGLVNWFAQFVWVANEWLFIKNTTDKSYLNKTSSLCKIEWNVSKCSNTDAPLMFQQK